jgi:acyl-CoA thioesterase FadM
MILLLRLLTTLVTGQFKRRIDPLGWARLVMRVWPNDCDLNFHMNSGRYVSFFDLGRIDLLIRMKIFRQVLKLGWRPLVGGAIMRYRRSLLPFERFQLRSRVLGWDEKWFYFEHRIERMNGEYCAIAYVRGLLRGPDGNVPPSELVALAGRAGLPSPPLPPTIAQWTEAEPGE